MEQTHGDHYQFKSGSTTTEPFLVLHVFFIVCYVGVCGLICICMCVMYVFYMGFPTPTILIITYAFMSTFSTRTHTHKLTIIHIKDAYVCRAFGGNETIGLFNFYSRNENETKAPV